MPAPGRARQPGSDGSRGFGGDKLQKTGFSQVAFSSGTGSGKPPAGRWPTARPVPTCSRHEEPSLWNTSSDVSSGKHGTCRLITLGIY